MERPNQIMVQVKSQSKPLVLDRISHLPAEILCTIFSRLPPNQNSRLSVLSKRFKNSLCLYNPYLYFSANFDDSSNWQERYANFIGYIDGLLKKRQQFGIQLHSFVFHWWTNGVGLPFDVLDVDGIFKIWVAIATDCNVRVVDLLLKNPNASSVYRLPDSVFRCQSLRVLRLNLQTSIFRLESDVSGRSRIEELGLYSMRIIDVGFGERICAYFSCLKKLILDNVVGINDLNVTGLPLEELRIKNCSNGLIMTSAFLGWNLEISSSSFKILSISNCIFSGSCKINLTCQSMQDFGIHKSHFHEVAMWHVDCATLKHFHVCSSNFLGLCRYWISTCPSIDRINIHCCNFERDCRIVTQCLSIEDLTVSDCTVAFNSKLNPDKCIFIVAQNLEALGLTTLDKDSQVFPLKFRTPKLCLLSWRGNPIEYKYLDLDGFLSLANAKIDIKSSCKHNRREVSRRCKQAKSLTYCVGMLIKSLSYVTTLTINTWLIETFFMRNVWPIKLCKLEHLVLLVDGPLPAQIPPIATFLRGLCNLKTLVIKSEQKSALFSNPDLINKLGLEAESFVISVSEDAREVQIARIKV